MRKIVLLCLAVFFVHLISAQTNLRDSIAGIDSVQIDSRDSVIRKDKVRFGIKVGGQISAVDEIHNGSGRRFPGLTAGVMMQIPLYPEDTCRWKRWYFVPELLYSQEGERGDEWKKTEEKKFYQDYLALPLLLKFYPKKCELFYLEFGPKLSYMIYQKNGDIDWSEPNKFDIGLCLGGGLNFGRYDHFELGARLNLGLLDMYPDVQDRNFNIGGAVTLVYLFGKRFPDR